nr:MAG TPA: hypothetical protein [Caudoviricetes sp.]
MHPQILVHSSQLERALFRKLLQQQVQLVDMLISSVFYPKTHPMLAILLQKKPLLLSLINYQTLPEV